MIQVSIFRDSVLTNQGQFPSREEAETWVGYHGFIDPVYEDITEQLFQSANNEAAKNYLASTDWYIIRELDSGEPCPSEIKQARAEARAKIIR